MRFLFFLNPSLCALIVPEEFNSHPFPQMEEDIDRDGDWQEEAVETQTAGTCASLREVLIHRGRVKQSTYGDNRDQHCDGGQRKHPSELCSPTIVLW